MRSYISLQSRVKWMLESPATKISVVEKRQIRKLTATYLKGAILLVQEVSLTKLVGIQPQQTSNY
ncbi:hypothetical protein H5410_027635 [Solanum commersonii]|uniref:Uncharacterized protein n=1 Tax=Solanum commersonii TaxID=4109 RepID=A0A9J5Z2L3_SOLCO|nr:hypothetical protein H5410_027635 [Solanum commersonii]